MVSTRLQSGCVPGSPAGAGCSSSPPHCAANEFHPPVNSGSVASNATSVIVPPAGYSSLTPHAGNQLQTLSQAATSGATGSATSLAKVPGLGAAASKVLTGGVAKSTQIHLMQFPTELLEKIFLHFDFRTISSLRLVNRRMNIVCGSILSTTFNQLQSKIIARFQAIKSKMPRRESARRQHPLACESDIIEMLHMRLALLQMSFGKHIERQHCCFFAGEILDEIFRILHYIKTTPRLARPYKVTDELFDLSTMAMEYFKEKIEPTLPEITYFGTDFIDIAGPFPSSKIDSVGCGSESGGCGFESTLELSPPRSPPQSNMVLRKRIHKIKQGMKRYSSQLTLMKRELKLCKVKLGDQTKTVVDYATRLDEYDKKNEETSRKFSSVLQELNKCKTELQFFRSKFPFNPDCTCSGPLVATEVLSPQAIHLPPSGGGLDDLVPAPLEQADPGLQVAAVPLAGSASPRATEDETAAAAPTEAIVKKLSRSRATNAGVATSGDTAATTMLPSGAGDAESKESISTRKAPGKRLATHISAYSEDSSGGSDQEAATPSISRKYARGNYHASSDPCLPSTSGETSLRTKKRKSSTAPPPGEKSLRGAALPVAGTSGLCKRSRR